MKSSLLSLCSLSLVWLHSFLPLILSSIIVNYPAIADPNAIITSPLKQEEQFNHHHWSLVSSLLALSLSPSNLLIVVLTTPASLHHHWSKNNSNITIGVWWTPFLRSHHPTCWSLHSLHLHFCITIEARTIQTSHGVWWTPFLRSHHPTCRSLQFHSPCLHLSSTVRNEPYFHVQSKLKKQCDHLVSLLFEFKGVLYDRWVFSI
jgi:hypothetical protein